MTPRRGRPDRRHPVADNVWQRHDREFRDPHEVTVQWQRASDWDRSLLEAKVTGPWWDLLESLGITLVVTREYEHLVTAFWARRGEHRTSFLRLPHPNGLAFDGRKGRLYIASTRNPNVLFDFAPYRTAVPPARDRNPAREGALLLPARARYLPGSLYLHDLAMVGGRLYGCAAGLNAVVLLPDQGGFRAVWWPRTVDGSRERMPRLDRNYLQLNSIAAGRTLRSSYFTASCAAPGRRRPGQVDFRVDRRGVLFSGRTRDVSVTGLTRPHSARFWRRQVWLNNSGYGEFGAVIDSRFQPIRRLPGWTRGLCFAGRVAFVATSRVIPRFRSYAPGLDVDKSRCGVHAIDPKSGATIASVEWPQGNQIFAVEAVPGTWTRGFPFSLDDRRNDDQLRDVFFRGTI